MTTAFVFHELYLWHDTGHAALLFPPGLTVQPGEHAENPETKRRMKNLLEVSGITDHLSLLKPRRATEDELARFHTRRHIADIREKSAAGGGEASHLTPFGPGSFEIAQLAAGGAIVAMDAVLSGAAQSAYALIRPPGHHALADLGMGFCLFANAVVAIHHARAVHGLGRVAVIDWDVHHGNGTEKIFYDDPSVLSISLHQDNLYPPNSGPIDAKGEGPGEGANLNIPLPPGSGSGAYRYAFEQLVLPALEQFKPELIVILSGFDYCALDPLGMQMLESRDYAWLTKCLMEVADKYAKGRIIVTHEGGYSPVYVPYCGVAVLETLSEANARFEDPFSDFIAGYGGQSLSPDQKKLIHDVKDAFFS